MLLAFDTSGGACSVAVLRDGAIVAREFREMTRGHAEALLPMIDAALLACGGKYDGIERIAVTVGPGSFTGVRTGVATARGIALALSVPVVAVTALEAVAWAAREEAAPGDLAILVGLETRRSDIYCQLFASDLAPVTEPAAMPAEGAAALAGGAAVFVAGDAAHALRPFLDPGVTGFSGGAGIPDAGAIARLAAGRAAGGAPEPLYLHPPLATIPAAGGRLRP